jgi:hypothetical protein
MRLAKLAVAAKASWDLGNTVLEKRRIISQICLLFYLFFYFMVQADGDGRRKRGIEQGFS